MEENEPDEMDENKWQAESDARIMEEHAMICADPKRKESAMKIVVSKQEALGKMMEENSKEEGKAKKRFPSTYKES